MLLSPVGQGQLLLLHLHALLLPWPLLMDAAPSCCQQPRLQSCNLGVQQSIRYDKFSDEEAWLVYTGSGSAMIVLRQPGPRHFAAKVSQCPCNLHQLSVNFQNWTSMDSLQCEIAASLQERL